MLARISSPELADWAAYEQAFGPLGRIYADDMLANIEEALQAVYLSLTATEESGAQEVTRRPRPHEFFSTMLARVEAEQVASTEEAKQAEIAAFLAEMDKED